MPHRQLISRLLLRHGSIRRRFRRRFLVTLQIFTSKYVLCLLTSVLGMLANLLLAEVSVLDRFENSTWDVRAALTADPNSADPKIVIVVIDQTSLDSYSENGLPWPWPRAMYVDAIRYLKSSGARVIGVDMLFTEISSFGPGDDASLAEILRGSPPVVTAVGLRKNLSGSDAELALFRERLTNEKLSVPPRWCGFEQPENQNVMLSIAQLLQTSPWFGHVSNYADLDGVVRRVRLQGSFDGRTIPSLSLAMYLATHTNAHDCPIDPDALTLSGLRDSVVTVRYRGPAQTYRTVAIADVIGSFQAQADGEPPIIAPEVFRDAYVFIGPNAPALWDFKPTSVDSKMPGVEVHATALDNLLHRDFVRFAPTSINHGLTAAHCILAAGICFFVQRWFLLLPTLSIVFVSLIGSTLYAAHLGWWLPLIAPFGAVITTVITSLLAQYQVEGRQRRFIKNAFRYYVSAPVIDQIIDNPSSLALGGAKRELTIFFSDIAGFTAITEKLDPTQLVRLLNDFLTSMTDIIMESGGTIDKYEGDAIIAFWNAPLEVRDHAERAVGAALDCQRVLAKKRLEWKEEFDVDVYMRVGLHTGVVTVGNFGSRERFNYTIIGDAANLASRLEGVNKVFGTEILVSGVTREQCDPARQFRHVADVQVVGKATSISIFEPHNEPHNEQWPELEIWNEGYALYAQGKFEQARARFQALPEDAVARTYLARLDVASALAQSEGEWSPVWKLTEK